jgi:hypothetical protein
VAEVFAGFICGYALALAVTPLAAIAVIRTPVGQTATGGTLPKALSVTSLSVVLHGLAFLIFTAIGLALGLLLYGMEDSRPASGVGSPNAAFTVLMIAVVAIAFLPMAIFLPRWRLPLLLGGALFAVMFGWAMPWFAEAARS